MFACIHFTLQTNPTVSNWESLYFNMLWLAALIYTTWSTFLVYSSLTKMREFEVVSQQYIVLNLFCYLYLLTYIIFLALYPHPFVFNPIIRVLSWLSHDTNKGVNRLVCIFRRIVSRGDVVMQLVLENTFTLCRVSFCGSELQSFSFRL